MIFLMVFYVLTTLARIQSNTVTSPRIRILDVATKTSETRLIPQRIEYQNSFHPYFHQQNRYDQNTVSPLKSYVIYDEYPLKIFKEWKSNPPTEFSSSAPQNYFEFGKQPNAEFPPVYYFQNGQQILTRPKPTLAYSSVYSNVIKVFDDSLNSLDRNRFQSEKYIKPYEGNVWKSQPPAEYEPVFSQEIPRREFYHDVKLPDNFPKVFSPNDKFHFPSLDEGVRQPPKFYPEGGYYDTHTINYNRENTRHRDEVEVLPEGLKQKNQKKPFLCSFIRVNQRQFPENGGPCARSDDNLLLIPAEYPNYSNLPNDKIPMEHRRQHFQFKRIKRSELNESFETRQKRDAGFGYGYSGWGSPFNYESGYDGYFSDNYPSRGSYRDSSYYSNNNRNRNQNYRSRYYTGSRYDDYDDDYQSDDSNSKGLSGYLTNGGRRYKKGKSNNEDENDDYDYTNSENNHDDDSDEEMERMNSNRRDTNDRRNNDDSRERRRNNNNNNSNNNNNNNNKNDDDEYRDTRRNNNRNNSRRYNNNRRNNDRYDSNSNRNRYYSSSNGYNNNNGYGSSYGSYGNNYGGFGSGGYGSGGYGSGGYGSGYGSNGGYGYGGYGNGFGSF